MKVQTFLLTLAALWPLAASAQTPVPITVFNPLFEDDTLNCSPGNCSSTNITGWLVGPQTVLQKMSTSQYPNAPVGGLYVAAIGDSSATGSILQTLGVTVQANTTYVLKLGVGARADYPFTGYLASLMAGNVTVASGHSATPVGGSFVFDVIEYSSGAAPAQLGQPLQIFVKSVGAGQVDVAAVSLTMQ
jgi:hypothetical protein